MKKLSFSLLSPALVKASAVMLVASLVAGGALVGCDETTKASKPGASQPKSEGSQSISGEVETTEGPSADDEAQIQKQIEAGLAEPVDEASEQLREDREAFKRIMGDMILFGASGGTALLMAAHHYEGSGRFTSNLADMISSWATKPEREILEPKKAAFKEALQARSDAISAYKSALVTQGAQSEMLAREMEFKKLLMDTNRLISELKTGEQMSRHAHREVETALGRISKLAPEMLSDDPTSLERIRKATDHFLNNPMVRREVTQELKVTIPEIIKALEERPYSPEAIKGYADESVVRANAQLSKARRLVESRHKRLTRAHRVLNYEMSGIIGQLRTRVKPIAVKMKGSSVAVGKRLSLIGVAGAGAVAIYALYDLNQATAYVATQEDGKPTLRPVSGEGPSLEFEDLPAMH